MYVYVSIDTYKHDSAVLEWINALELKFSYRCIHEMNLNTSPDISNPLDYFIFKPIINQCKIPFYITSIWIPDWVIACITALRFELNLERK